MNKILLMLLMGLLALNGGCGEQMETTRVFMSLTKCVNPESGQDNACRENLYRQVGGDSTACLYTRKAIPGSDALPDGGTGAVDQFTMTLSTMSFTRTEDGAFQLIQNPRQENFLVGEENHYVIVFIQAGTQCTPADEFNFSANSAAEYPENTVLVFRDRFAVPSGTGGTYETELRHCNPVWGRGADQPPVEICDNGGEDDCNGKIDLDDLACRPVEDMGPPIDMGPTPCDDAGAPCETGNPGVCAQGTLQCQDNALVCVPNNAPTEEALACGDGLDNDCNGLTDAEDEQCECRPGEQQECFSEDDEGVSFEDPSICTRGVRFCREDGTWGDCLGEVLPQIGEACYPNGVDEDCDGEVDEDAMMNGTLCSSGTGACQREGWWSCNIDGVIECSAVAGEPGVELCNGIDDDCDGEIDEAPQDMGEDCDVPGAEGVCRAGTLTCHDGEAVCQQLVFPSDEVCDGLDNDCDGQNDNQEGEALPLQQECYDGNQGDLNNGSPCRGGSSTCVLGNWGPCENQVLPGVEICDSVDNDCDGTVDNPADGGSCECDPGETRACYTAEEATAGVGPCQHGQQTCTMDGSGWGPCAGEVVPDIEVCDGVDNDCDGIVDDVDGLNEACAAGEGACRVEGLRVCDIEQRALTCNAVAAEPGDNELCNDIDDDCDGQVDEELGLDDACQIGVGACQSQGVLICDDEGGTMCAAEVILPSPEVCDGTDNDCNGIVDDVDGVGDLCQDGVGACERNGEVECHIPTGRLRCTAVPGQPQAEVCNGADDNCDGQIDENLGLGMACSAGEGVCEQFGQIICAEGGGTTCSAQEVEPGPEICDGLDNDCNGTPDDPYDDLGTACERGVGACHSVGEMVCSADQESTVCNAEVIEPEAERCDEIDHDCDGDPSNGFDAGQPCEVGQGACFRQGTRICTDDGSATECDTVAGDPEVETCNDVDDDCDGAVDEDFNLGDACTVGQGVCERSGITICQMDGSAACSAAPGDAQAEVCDTLDNDCDGAVDEGLDCEIEICDGVDNNGNGEVDEGLENCCAGIEIGNNFACAPTGNFLMGQGDLSVTFTYTYIAQRAEVSQGIWENLLGLPNPSRHTGPTLPVHDILITDAAAGANALSFSQGYEECYIFGEANGEETVTLTGLDCTGYRVPTEYEWEYLATAGGTQRGLYGNRHEIAVHSVAPSTNETPQPVCGDRPTNGWGMCDTLGNVWELVWSGRVDYPANPVIDGGMDQSFPHPSGEVGKRGGGYYTQAAAEIDPQARGFDNQVQPNRAGVRFVRTIAHPAWE